MTIEAILERIAVALEKRSEPVSADVAGPNKPTTKGKPRKGSTTAEEKAGATEAELVPPQPTVAAGSTAPATALPSTASAAVSTPVVTPDPPAAVTKVDTKVTLEALRAAVQAYRARKYPGDPQATEKVQEDLFTLVSVRRLGDIKGEDYVKVVEAFKAAA